MVLCTGQTGAKYSQVTSDEVKMTTLEKCLQILFMKGDDENDN